MYDEIIRDNVATNNGGGVYIGTGHFAMHGGTIKNKGVFTK